MKKYVLSSAFIIIFLITGCPKPVPVSNADPNPNPGGNTVDPIYWELNSDRSIVFLTAEDDDKGFDFFLKLDDIADPMVVVGLHTAKPTGHIDGAYGLLFCMQDFENLYMLSISNFGDYCVDKCVDDSWTNIIGWTYSDQLYDGAGYTNMLRVRREDSTNTFTITANSFDIDSFIDSTFSGGDTGLMVEVRDDEDFPDSPVEVHFNLPEIIATPAAGLVTSESGLTSSFEVVLGTMLEEDLLINFSSGDSSEGSLSPSSINFTMHNWDTPQTITVTGLDDDVADGDIGYVIIATAESFDLIYDDMDIPDISVTNLDNE